MMTIVMTPVFMTTACAEVRQLSISAPQMNPQSLLEFPQFLRVHGNRSNKITSLSVSR